MALTQGLWSGTGAALARVGKEGTQQESDSPEVGVQRAGRNTSRQREGEAAIPAEGACAAPAVGHPLVPGGKPQRAKQFFKSTVKLQGLGEKVTCKSRGFQEAGREKCPHLASIMEGLGYHVPSHHTRCRIPCAEERSVFDG